MNGSSLLLNFIFALVTGVVVWFICKYVLQRIIDHIIQSESEQRKKLICGILLGILIIAGVIALYLFYCSLETNKVDVNIWGIFFVWTVQLTSGYLLYSIKRKKQYGNKFNIIESRGESFTIEVRRLHVGNLGCNTHFKVNGDTFLDGINFLVEQTIDRFPKVRPDICIGINAVGMAMASIFTKKYPEGRKLLGYISTRPANNGRVVDEDNSFLPPDDGINTIMVFDDEVKKGGALKCTLDHLKEKYKSVCNIESAILVAAQLTPRIEKIDNIAELDQKTKGVFSHESDYLPDFVAFVSRNPISLK